MSTSRGSEPMVEREDLLARQFQLQAEAAAVAEELNLIQLLKAAACRSKLEVRHSV